MYIKKNKIRKAKTWGECEKHAHVKKAWVEQGKGYLVYHISLKDGLLTEDGNGQAIKEESIKAAVIELNRVKVVEQ
jgi:hypothetical protein